MSFGDVEYGIDAAAQVNAPFEYTDITIGADGSPSVAPDPHTPDGPVVMTMLRLGAAAQAPVRLASGERFARTASPDAPSLRARGWTVADPDTGAAVARWRPGPRRRRISPAGSWCRARN